MQISYVIYCSSFDFSGDFHYLALISLHDLINFHNIFYNKHLTSDVQAIIYSKFHLKGGYGP